MVAGPGTLFAFLVYIVATVAGAWYAFTNWNGLGTHNWVGLKNFGKVFSDPANTPPWRTRSFCDSVRDRHECTWDGSRLAFNRLPKSRNVLRVVLFVPSVLSPLAVSYVWWFVFQYKRLLNQLLGAVGLESWQRTWLADPTWSLYVVLLVTIWQGAGIPMVIYLAGLAGVPVEVEEAAVLDGAPSS